MFSGSRSNILSALSYQGRLACRFRKFFFPFLVALSVSLASAQPLLHFRNVDGLSQQMVYNMHLDKKGFLWISTSDGLNRYDGSTMRVYRPENDSHVPGLGGCIIRSRILEDSTGKLWLSTENGVYFFSPRTEKFYPVSFSYKGRLKRIASEPIAIAEGKIWLYNGWLGLFCYSPHQGTLRSYGSPQSGAAEIINPIEFHFDGREIIYAATRQGVYSFNLKNGAWEAIISLKECRALTLMQDTLYVSHENGVKYISMRSKTDGVMVFSESYNGPIRCFFADSNGHLWAGDNGGGIWLKRKGMPLFERAGYPGKFSGTANGFSVYSISGINGRVLFAGGDVFGLKVADLHKPVFQNYPSVNAEYRITPVFITGIAGHSNGTIFAGTMGEGFLHKPAGRETFSRFPVPGFLNEKTVRTSAMNDEKGNVWLTYGNNLLLLDHQGKIADRIKLQVPVEAAYSSIMVNCISAFDGYWLAGTNCGLYKIEKGTANYIKSFGINNVHCLWQQNSTSLWVGTEAGGVVVTNPGPSMSNKQQLLDGATVKHIMHDKEKNLIWISTTNGLVAMNPRNGEYCLYNEKDGLPNNYCYGTLLHEKDIWLSTNKGISRISPHPEKGKVFPYLNIVNFTSADGLPSNEFNSRSFFGGKDGNLYFGSIMGLTWFNPSGFSSDIPPPATFLAGVLVNGRSADTTIAADFLRQLRLHWRQNELTFQLGVISYINTSPIEFEVQLKGYDTIPWQLSGHSLVRYTNLSPGRYTFLAKARGDGGNWGNAVNLEIFITSPYWKRWWFFALVILLLMAIGAAVSFLVSDRKMKLQALELEKQKELEKERQRISREMHDDIGAGLTRITLMADMIARKKEGISEVKEISSTSRKLVGSMREIIWTMNPENGTLERLFAYLRETFKSQVEYSGIEGRVSFPDKPPDMILNNEQLHHIILVCREAVNNAICHSGCKNILLQSGIKDNSLWFCIMDDGKGLPETDTKRGNGLRNMKSRIAELGGEFLLETGVNRGTSIRFFIPLHA